MKRIHLAALLSTVISLGATSVLAQQITLSSPLSRGSMAIFKLPDGRHMGSISTVAGDSHGNIWIAERCGANDCAGSPLDPMMEFDPQGNFIKKFGAGQLLFPHFLYIDKQDHLWIVDDHDNGKIGDDVIEYDPDGHVLKTLGTPGVAGRRPDPFPRAQRGAGGAQWRHLRGRRPYPGQRQCPHRQVRP